MNEYQAKKLYESKFWEGYSHKTLADFQMGEDLLCMPFEVFHEAVEKTLGRPVWTHEFAYPDRLRAELWGVLLCLLWMKF